MHERLGLRRGHRALSGCLRGPSRGVHQAQRLPGRENVLGPGHMRAARPGPAEPPAPGQRQREPGHGGPRVQLRVGLKGLQPAQGVLLGQHGAGRAASARHVLVRGLVQVHVQLLAGRLLVQDGRRDPAGGSGAMQAHGPAAAGRQQLAVVAQREQSPRDHVRAPDCLRQGLRAAERVHAVRAPPGIRQDLDQLRGMGEQQPGIRPVRAPARQRVDAGHPPR